MRWLPVGLASQKPEYLLPNEERVSRGLSGERQPAYISRLRGVPSRFDRPAGVGEECLLLVETARPERWRKGITAAATCW